MATDKEVNEITTLRNSGVRAGEIEIEIPEHEMLDRVLSGESFIVKNIFPADELRKMYLEVFRSYEGTQSRFQKYAWGMENFWRTDLNPAASKTKKIQAMYYILTWNNEFPKAAKLAACWDAFATGWEDFLSNTGFGRKTNSGRFPYCIITPPEAATLASTTTA